MLKFAGKGVYGAIAIGKVSIFKKNAPSVQKREISDVEKEKKRFEISKQKAKEELNSIYEKTASEIGNDSAQIFEIHSMMIDDEDYNEAVIDIIENEKANTEYAVFYAGEKLARMFSSMDDSYMRARANDIRDISGRIIDCLNENKSEKTEYNEGSVICAVDLEPSETVSLNKEKVFAFVTEQGAQTSHTAILSRNMNIPAVVCVGESFLEKIKDGDTITVDGYSGEVIISPDENTLEKVRKKREKDIKRKELLQKLKGKENLTLDGKRIDIFANIGSVDDIESVNENDAGGIGLFRSEFSYLGRDDFPKEEELFSSYKTILERMNGKKVIIRTLDIGADKQAEYFNIGKEENPALGLRAIRIFLTRPKIFRTQMRALYRASVYGNLGIMFPMITSVCEVEKVLSFCKEIREELRKEGIECADNIEMGIMIETPAAAIISDKLAPLVDFFSVGTNDLTQYTLACDRQNPKIENFTDTHHEAILRLIEFSSKNAHKYGKWIGICGELASDTSLTKEFLKMGIDELSVSPSYILKLRDTVRNISLL